MNIKLAQLKYRVANFDYNYENIVKNFDTNTDLMIFPDIEENCTMNFDSNYQEKRTDFFDKLIKNYPNNTFLIGKTLLKKGKIYNISEGYFDCCNKKIYV